METQANGALAPPLHGADWMPRALQNGTAAHALQAVEHPWSLVAVTTRATMPVVAVPAVTYFGARQMLRDHPRGAEVASNLGLGTGAAVEGLFGPRGGLLRERALRSAPAAVTSAAQGHRLLAGIRHVAGFLGKAVPGVIALGGGLTAIKAVDQHGEMSALATTSEGRRGALHVVGGALTLAPHPVLKLAGAGAFLLAASNEADHLDALDGPPRSGGPSVRP